MPGVQERTVVDPLVNPLIDPRSSAAASDPDALLQATREPSPSTPAKPSRFAHTELPIPPAPATPQAPDSAPPELVDILRCEQCGGVLSADDIFCGECGYLSRTASDSFSRPRDTAVIKLLPPDSIPEMPRPDLPRQQGRMPRTRLPNPPRAAPGAPLPHPIVAPSLAPGFGRPTSAGNSFGLDDHDDVEATRIVHKRVAGARFVLQFSTGESVTVHGTGLIGRNPQPEPAEYFDQIVRVFDPSKSVSKTHLEFGQEAGSFWIKDRFSGNGSVLREPDSKPILCNPDRRYRLERGARVDIGEQFFVVS
ncbi:MAG: hypothetical protein QOD27_2099 [Microbacteriaceae bacterium]|nr:hypothetical protein [Microbacteriaceae bacterium]